MVFCHNLPDAFFCFGRDFALHMIDDVGYGHPADARLRGNFLDRNQSDIPLLLYRYTS